VPLLVLGLEAISTSSIAAVVVAWLVAVADGEVEVDGEVEGEREVDGEDEGEGEVEGEGEGDGEGEVEGEVTMTAWLTLAEGDTDRLSLTEDGLSLAEVEWRADEVPDGDADADADLGGEVDVDGEGEGEGEDVACDGSAWHAASVAVVATGAACALPAMPRVRKLPLSRVATATLTYAKRIRIACLR
jgi:hypothetical protein